jgi:hypothetical protein
MTWLFCGNNDTFHIHFAATKNGDLWPIYGAIFIFLHDSVKILQYFKTYMHHVKNVANDLAYT